MVHALWVATGILERQDMYKRCVLWAQRLIVSREMTSSCSVAPGDSHSHAERVYSAAIAAVSPVKLVSSALSFDRVTSTLIAGDTTYKLDRYTLAYTRGYLYRIIKLWSFKFGRLL